MNARSGHQSVPQVANYNRMTPINMVQSSFNQNDDSIKHGLPIANSQYKKEQPFIKLSDKMGAKFNLSKGKTITQNVAAMSLSKRRNMPPMMVAGNFQPPTEMSLKELLNKKNGDDIYISVSQL